MNYTTVFVFLSLIFMSLAGAGAIALAEENQILRSKNVRLTQQRDELLDFFEAQGGSIRSCNEGAYEFNYPEKKGAK